MYLVEINITLNYKYLRIKYLGARKNFNERIAAIKTQRLITIDDRKSYKIMFACYKYPKI